MAESNISMSLSNPHPANFNSMQKVGLSVTALGILAIFLAWAGDMQQYASLWEIGRASCRERV